MAYKRRYRKRTFRRSRRPSYKAVARIAQKVVSKNQETKEKKYDYSSVGIDPVGGSAVSLASVSYGSSTIITQLFRGITQGTAESNRIGSTVRVRGIYVNLAIQCASGSETNNFRMAIVRPKGGVTTTTVSALAQQIFSTAGSSTTQWLNPIDTNIFKIYWDKMHFIKPTDISTAGSVSQRFYRKFIKFGKSGITMKWDEGNNQPFRDFYLVAISDSSAVSHPGAIAGFIKLYFKDA